MQSSQSVKLEMALRFTYSQECFCGKRFKTLSAVEKHIQSKHTNEADSTRRIRLLDNEERVVAVPEIKTLDRRTKDYKEGYMQWLAGLTEQINSSLHPCLRG